MTPKRKKSRAPKPRTKKVNHKWWFGPETLDELRKDLNALPVGSGRLDVEMDEHSKTRDMTLTIVPDEKDVAQIAAVGHVFAPRNKSHYCPPDCP